MTDAERWAEMIELARDDVRQWNESCATDPKAAHLVVEWDALPENVRALLVNSLHLTRKYMDRDIAHTSAVVN